MKEYYDNEDYNEDNFQDDNYNEEEFEQFNPYYDEDEGEYKYIPAVQEQWQEPDYPDMADEGGSQANSARYDDNSSQKILEKIEHLKTEIDSSNKKTEEEKINRLSSEIKHLKHQLFQIKTANALKRQFDEFKKDFIRSQELKSRQHYYYQDPYYRRPAKPEYQNPYQKMPHKEQVDDIDIEKLVEKVKNDIYQDKDLDSQKILTEIEKINKSNLTELQIIEKINTAVEERYESIVTKLTELLDSRIKEIKNHTSVYFDETLNKVNDGEQEYGAKISELSEKLQQYRQENKAMLEEYNEKQNDVIVRFSELAEKIQSSNVIDKDDLYNETMLDGISDIKTDLKELLKKSGFESEINAIKENIDNVNEEITSLKESLSSIFTQATDYQFKLITTNIENIEESINALSESSKLSQQNIDDILQKKAETEQLMHYQQDINDLISAAKQDINDSISAVKQEIIDAISSQSFDQIKDDLTNSIQEILEQKTAAIISEVENLKALREEIASQLSDLRQSVTDDISAQSSQIEQLKAQLEEIKAQAAEVPNSEIKDLTINIENLLNSFVKASENNTTAVEGMGISIDNLLRQQEDNIATQTELSEELAKLNAQINAVTADTRELSEKVGDSKADSGLFEKLSKKFEELLKQKDTNNEEIKALFGELEEIKLLLSGIANADLSYDLSSIYSELRKINQSGSANIDQIKLSQELNSLRSQLDNFSQPEQQNKEE
jgi:uncharacterized coiled-coil DUF342 family protein